jgi:hypothetical protein
MASDSHLFHAEPGDGRVPLYEAKMAHQFTHRWATYDGDETREVTEAELQRPDFTVAPRWWVDEDEVNARLAGRWDGGWLVGWRDITTAVNERTMIASILPRVAIGGTLLLFFGSPEPLVGSCLLATFNSFVFDYVARQKVAGTHLNLGIIQQLPLLEPQDYLGAAPWSSERQVAFWIQERSLELVYTASDVESFARDLGYDGPPFRWDADRRSFLRCELDAAFFHLYGLERDDVDYVMDTFWVVRDRDVKAHGEYRTKRLILEIYDELAEAIATGRPYQTRLDPPPADPRVAHPSSDSARAQVSSARLEE